MPRRVVLLVSWLLATAAATGLAWAGVQVVAGRVVDPLPPLGAAEPGANAGPSLPSQAPATPTPATPTPVTRAPAETTTIPPPSPTPGATPVGVQTRSYDLVGGTLTVRFSATRVEVLTASPKEGFILRPIEREGPTDVEVEFRRADDSWRSELRATWERGPAERIEERDRS